MPKQKPVAALIDIVEKGAPTDPGPGGIVIPSDVRINGTSLLTSAQHPVVINEIDIENLDAVYVTLTLIARRVRIGLTEDLTTEVKSCTCEGGVSW